MVYLTLLYTVETGILVNYLSYTARYIFFYIFYQIQKMQVYFFAETAQWRHIYFQKQPNAGIFLFRNSPMQAYFFSETAKCRYISFQKKPNAYIHISFQKQPNAGSFFFSETAQCRHISFQKKPNAGSFFYIRNRQIMNTDSISIFLIIMQCRIWSWFLLNISNIVLRLCLNVKMYSMSLQPQKYTYLSLRLTLFWLLANASLDLQQSLQWHLWDLCRDESDSW